MKTERKAGEKTLENVIIYTADHCKFCEAAKQVLNQKGVAYEERNVYRCEQFLNEARELGNRWLPIIKTKDQVLVFPTMDEIYALLD